MYNDMYKTLNEAEGTDISNIEELSNFLDEFNFREHITPYDYSWMRETNLARQVISIDKDELIFWENGNEKRYPFNSTEDVESTLDILRDNLSGVETKVKEFKATIKEKATNLGFNLEEDEDLFQRYSKSGNYDHLLLVAVDKQPYKLIYRISNETEICGEYMWHMGDNMDTAFEVISHQMESVE